MMFRQISDRKGSVGLYAGILLPAVLLLIVPTRMKADSAWLYGIHWWGYTQGQPIDTTPASLLDCPTYGGWDVETVVTHSGTSWWEPAYFVPLYQYLYTRNVTPITRIDYNGGQTGPSPTNPDYAAWPTSCVNAVNALRSYCHLWIIGNECNLLAEGNSWPNNQITPADYATIYRNVRNAIRSSALPNPANPHLVLIAPPSPGGVISGTRWISGTNWLSQVIDNIPISEIDGFAIHSYGGTVAEFHSGYVDQLTVIDNKGLADRPVYMTEWNRAATPGNATEEAAAAQFCRDAYLDVRTWNQGNGHHNIICMAWFTYDANQQAGNGWNRYSIEYWRGDGNPLGNSGDLYTAFEQTVDLRYPAGIVGTPGNNMNGTIPTGINLSLSATQVQTDTAASGYDGAKAIDGVVSSASKWKSVGTSPPHWLALDLGGQRVVNGFIIRHASSARESTSYNTEAFQVQSASSMSGPWSNECIVNNTTQAAVTYRSYKTAKSLRYVRLYITDPGSDYIARIPEFEVIGLDPPHPAFTATPLSGFAPMTVQFTNQTTGEYNTCFWNFGDSGTSNWIHPSHTYTQPGRYTVSLTVSGMNGDNMLTKTAYIVVNKRADINSDAHVDSTDFDTFSSCYNGPTNLVSGDCLAADFNNDQYVDSADFDVFSECYNGPVFPQRC